MWTAIQYDVAVPVRHGVPDTQVIALSSPDRTLGVSADRVKILQGQLFNPGAAGQAVIDQELASLEHLQPGGTLHLLGIPNNPKTGNPEFGQAVPLAFRVTAIAVFDNQVIPTTETNSEPMALLSPSFTATRAARSFYYDTQAGVRLRPGASMTGFLQAASALAKRYPATGGSIVVVNLSDEVAATERAIRPQAVALAVFAVLAGLIGLAVIGQLLARQLVLDSAEFPVLRALGMTRASLAALALARLAAVTVAGAVIAVGVAIAASPLMPIGPARLAEPTPGIEVNLAVLGVGLRRDRGAAAGAAGGGGLARGGPGAGAAGRGRAGRAGPAVAAGIGAGAGRVGARQHRGADGVRARAGTDRGPGPQCPGRYDRGGGRGGGRGGVRRQPDRPGRHPAPVRAELEPGTGPGIRRCFVGVLGAKVLSSEPAITGYAGGRLRPAHH